MKLNTLYKSVSVECAVYNVVHSSDLCRHQTTQSVRINQYVRMRVVVHSLATYGANTTRSVVSIVVIGV